MPIIKHLKTTWKTTWKAPTPPITALTIAYFALSWDSCSGNIQWSGVGKYVNYAFRYTAIVCAIIYLIGFYRKKWAQLMRPMLYVLGFGILFGITAAICFPLGLDITGNTNIDASTTKEFSSVYSFAIVRSFVCLVLWIFHFINYVDKVNQREEDEAEKRGAANNALSDNVV